MDIILDKYSWEVELSEYNIKLDNLKNIKDLDSILQVIKDINNAWYDRNLKINSLNEKLLYCCEGEARFPSTYEKEIWYNYYATTIHVKHGIDLVKFVRDNGIKKIVNTYMEYLSIIETIKIKPNYKNAYVKSDIEFSKLDDSWLR